MKTIFWGLVFFLSLLSWWSCQTKPWTAKAGQAIISYAKGPCFGSCPQFEMNIFVDGRVWYKGIKNTPRAGDYFTKISKKQVKDWHRWFSKIHFDTLPEMANMEIMDAPITTIRHKAKTIKSKGTPEQNLQVIVDSLNRFIEQASWQLVLPAMDKHIIPHEIIVKLTIGTDLQTWLDDFKKFGLTLKQTISRSSNTHVVSFNPSEHDPVGVFLTIQKNKKVQQAEFNKMLDVR